MPSAPGSSDQWFHPLIHQSEPRLNRRRLMLLGGSGLAAAALARPQLSLVAAQEATPDIGSIGDLIQDQITGEEDAVALLRDAAQTMAELDSFRFEIETVAGESEIFQGLSVGLIEGAVRRPLDFMATVTVNLPFGSIDVSAVGIEGSAWVQDPLSDSQWIALEGAEDIVAIINPDTLIVSSIGLIQNAAIDGTEQVDGEETTVVTGEVNFRNTADQLTGNDVNLPAEISSEPLPVTIWIDSENRVVEIEVAGPILSTERDDVIRAIRFFDFNEPVEIERPNL